MGSSAQLDVKVEAEFMFIQDDPALNLAIRLLEQSRVRVRRNGYFNADATFALIVTNKPFVGRGRLERKFVRVLDLDAAHELEIDTTDISRSVRGCVCIRPLNLSELTSPETERRLADAIRETRKTCTKLVRQAAQPKETKWSRKNFPPSKQAESSPTQ